MDGTAASPKDPLPGRGGFIVVAVLWLLAALAALAAVASVYMAQSATALSAVDGALQSEMLITAGLELTAYQLSAAGTARRPTHGGFRFRLAKSEVTVEFLSEAARINLNMAPKAVIAGLFTILGTQADAADQYADRVIEWRSPAKSNGQNEEDQLYRAAGKSYFPRRAPFETSDELWLVLGLPAALVERALPFVTVYSGMSEINVLDAPAEVIAALPGMTPLRLDAFLEQRDTLPPDPQFVLGALGGNQAGVTVNGSSAYRVRMRIIFPDRRGKTSEGVIMLSAVGDQQPYRVLSWRDEIDPRTGAARRPEEGR